MPHSQMVEDLSRGGGVATVDVRPAVAQDEVTRGAEDGVAVCVRQLHQRLVVVASVHLDDQPSRLPAEVDSEPLALGLAFRRRETMSPDDAVEEGHFEW